MMFTFPWPSEAPLVPKKNVFGRSRGQKHANNVPIRGQLLPN